MSEAGPEAAGYIAAWRPVSVPPQAAALARLVVQRAAPPGRKRAGALLWPAARLADFAASLGLGLVPEAVLHPSVIERFARAAPGLSDPPRRVLRATRRFIARRVVPQLHPADAALPRERAKAPYSAAEIAGYLAPADAQPTAARRARAAGLACLGAGAGLIRGDLRQIRGADVTARSGGVIAAVRGARPRAVPVLARYHERLLAAAAFAGAGLVTGGAESGRKNVTARLNASLAGGGGLPRLDTSRLRATWLADVADLPVRPPRSCTPPGSAVPSGSATWPPGSGRPPRPGQSGCSGAPGGDDPAGGVRGDHRRLRRRAADRDRMSPQACGPAS